MLLEKKRLLSVLLVSLSIILCVGLISSIIIFSGAPSDTYNYDDINKIMTDAQGMTYQQKPDGVMRINDERFLVFALRGKIGATTYTYTSKDFAWTWNITQTNNDYLFEGVNNNSNFIWKQRFYFYEDGSPMKIEHYIENNVADITEMKMFYIMSINESDVIEFNNTRYQFNKTVNKQGDFKIDSFDINDEYTFHFEDILEEGFNITNLYVGSGALVGYPEDILAIGFTKGNGNFNQGKNITIDPTFTTNDVESISVTPMGDESFIVAWCDETLNDAIWASYYTNGNQIATATTADTNLGGCNYDTSVYVSPLNSTHFVFAWVDLTDNQHSFKIYNINGTELVGETDLSSSNIDSVSVGAFNETHFVVGHSASALLDLYVKMHYSNGTNYTGSILVDDNIGSDSNSQSIAVFNNSAFVISWYDGTDNQVSMKLFYSNGTNYTGIIDVDDAGTTGFPNSVATFNETHFVIGWYDSADDDTSFRIYDSAGNNLTGTIDADETAGSTCYSVKVSALSETEFIISWDDAGSGNDETYKIYDFAGNNLTGDIVVDTTTSTSYEAQDSASQVSALDIGICNDNFVLAWADASNKAVWESYKNDGSAWYGNCDATEAIFSENDIDSIALAIIDENLVALAWCDDTQDDTILSLYYSNSTLKNITTVETETGGCDNDYQLDVFPINNTAFIFSYGDGQESDATFRIYDTDLNIIVNQVDFDGGIITAGLASSVTLLNESLLVFGLVEQNEDDAEFRVFYTNGTAYTTTIDVDTSVGTQSWTVGVATLNESLFVIAWYDDGTGENDASLQVFYSNGTAYSGIIDADTDVGIDSEAIAVASFNETNFVVGWHDSTDNDVSYKLFYANGTNYTGILDADDNVGVSKSVEITAKNETAFIISWYDNAEGDRSYMIVDSAGNNLTGVVDIDIGSITPPGDVASWESSTGIGLYNESFAIAYAEREDYAVIKFFGPSGGGWNGSIPPVPSTTVNVSDTISTSDSLAYDGDYSRNNPEGFSFAELISNIAEIFRSTSDDLSISESVVRFISNLIGVSDDITISESITRFLLGTRTSDQAIIMSDSVARLLNAIRGIDQDISISDSISRFLVWDRVSNQAITISESIVKIFGSERGIDQDISISDSISRFLLGTRTSEQDISISESIVKIFGTDRIVSDDISISDSISRFLLGIRTSEQDISISDSATRLLLGSRTSNQPIVMSDSVSTLGEYFRTQSQTINVIENITAVNVSGMMEYSRTASQTIIFSDSVARILNAIRGTSDDITISDSVVRLLLSSRISNQVISLSESIARILSSNRGVSDDITITDSIARILGSDRGIDQDISISDSIARILLGTRISEQDISISDSVSRTREVLTAISQTININDALTTLSNFYRTISNILNLLLDVMGLEEAPTPTGTSGEELPDLNITIEPPPIIEEIELWKILATVGAILLVPFAIMIAIIFDLIFFGGKRLKKKFA